MVQLGGEVMIGPLSGDEAVSIANWAKQNPQKTVIIGTAGSQDPTMQIAPKNLFRYHGDGAQWNAGLGEIVYRSSAGVRPRSIGDDYSFPWTSAAGIIADFCANRRQDHEAGVDAAGRRRLRAVHPPAAGARRRSTATSGWSEARTRALR